MNKNLLYALAFAAGGVAGFFGSRHYFSTKYQKIAQEEIDSVKATFAKRRKAEAAKPAQKNVIPIEEAKRKAEMAKEKPELTRYASYYKSPEEKPATASVEEPQENDAEPFVIPPDDFGDLPEYAKISLTYYADQKLADDDDREMSPIEIENAVGIDALNHFGEYEDDSVFVRNERLKCDYEILLDHRKYADVLKEKPYLQDE